MSLVESLLAGDRLALSRVLSQVENHTAQGQAALSALFPYAGRAQLVGVTGAPGTGKSSLVNQLARYYRRPPQAEQPRRVAVVAVDPSSPFTGGAILGDRIRMRDLAGDPGVFIRSMASRGSLGGLASTTTSLVQVLDAAGFEIILIETVGVGQAEVDVARLAHTVLVVEAPGMGDDVQAIKAGILEIADVLVVNKADQPGAANTERILRGMLELAHPSRRALRHHGRLENAPFPEVASPDLPLWMPPIQRTVATDGTGVPELVQAITRHQAYLQQSGGWQQREHYRLQVEMESLLRQRLYERLQEKLPHELYHQVLKDLVERRVSPQQAVDKLIEGGNL